MGKWYTHTLWYAMTALKHVRRKSWIMLNRDRDIYALLVVCDNAGVRNPSSLNSPLDHGSLWITMVYQRWPYEVASHRVWSKNTVESPPTDLTFPVHLGWSAKTRDQNILQIQTP